MKINLDNIYHMSLFKPYSQNLILAIILLLSYSVTGQYHVRPFDISKKITVLKNTKEGNLLYGTQTGELGVYDGVQFNGIEKFDANIHDIEIQEGNKYLLTDKGLYELKNGSNSQISRNNLDVLAKSEDNSFLVTTTGVYDKINAEYHPNKEVFFDINEIKHGSYFKLGEKACFRVDNKIYIKEKRWKEVVIHAENDFSILPWNSRQMLICDRKALITFDQEGYVDTLYKLEVENRSKIFKLSGSNILLCSNDSIGVFDMRKKELNNFYNLNTDLISDVEVDEWGNIWISAGSYLYQVIDRSNDNRNNSPIVAIESIRINGNKKEVKSSFRLDEDENEIEIDYSGVHLTYPQNLEFQSMLSTKNHSLGYNNSDAGEWTKATKEKNIEYRNLKAGKYTFQLRGSVDGAYYTYTKPIVFTVESDLFQSVWLFGIIGGIAILLVALFFNSRYNTLKEKSNQDRNKLIQENKMLMLQQKSLQLQMNPHFVFNALNSIQGLIAKNDNQKARRYLQEFSTMMRSVLNQSREETILLSEEVSYLKSYLNLEQMANNNKFDWEVNVDPKVEDDIQIPTMIIQPFVENAIIHGVKSLKDRRGVIRLNFEMDGNKIFCRVIDNGIGRKAAELTKSSSHKSVAIDVAKERLSTKMSNSREKPILYKDLIDENNMAKGTEVLITIPIMN